MMRARRVSVVCICLAFPAMCGVADIRAQIKLPKPQLAKPPERKTVPFNLLVTKDGYLVALGERVKVGEAKSLVSRIAKLLRRNRIELAEMTVVLRADAKTSTGSVQKLIEVCQDVGFENFALRARREPGKVRAVSPLSIRLNADANGRLARITCGQAVVKDIGSLQQIVFRHALRAADGLHVEVTADAKLQARHVIEVVNSLNVYRPAKGDEPICLTRKVTLTLSKQKDKQSPAPPSKE